MCVVVLYPDAYTPSAAGVPTVTSKGTVTAANWQKMQLLGCVFLRDSGNRDTNFVTGEKGTTEINGQTINIQWLISFEYAASTIFKYGTNAGYVRLVHDL